MIKIGNSANIKILRSEDSQQKNQLVTKKIKIVKFRRNLKLKAKSYILDANMNKYYQKNNTEPEIIHSRYFDSAKYYVICLVESK